MARFRRLGTRTTHPGRPHLGARLCRFEPLEERTVLSVVSPLETAAAADVAAERADVAAESAQYVEGRMVVGFLTETPIEDFPAFFEAIAWPGALGQLAADDVPIVYDMPYSPTGDVLTVAVVELPDAVPVSVAVNAASNVEAVYYAAPDWPSGTDHPDLPIPPPTSSVSAELVDGQLILVGDDLANAIYVYTQSDGTVVVRGNPVPHHRRETPDIHEIVKLVTLINGSQDEATFSGVQGVTIAVNGGDDIAMIEGTDSAIAGNLAIDGGMDDDGLYVQGGADGNVIIVDSGGNNHIDVSDADIAGDVSITGCDDRDSVGLSGRFGGSIVVDTHDGKDTVMLFGEVGGNATLLAGDGVSGLIVENVIIDGNLILQTGGGDDFLRIHSSSVGGAAAVDAGSGNDGIEILEMTVYGLLQFDGGDGQDEFYAGMRTPPEGEVVPAEAYLAPAYGIHAGHILLNTGSDEDRMVLRNCTATEDFDVSMGPGDDELDPFGNAASRSLLDGGGGTDVLYRNVPLNNDFGELTILGFEETIVPEAVDLGEVRFQQSDEDAPANQELWYRFESPRLGILTVEVAQIYYYGFDGPSTTPNPVIGIPADQVWQADLQLYVQGGDGQLEELAAGDKRVDFLNETAGQEYFLRATNVQGDARVRVANMVAADRETGEAAVLGSSGDDEVRVRQLLHEEWYILGNLGAEPQLASRVYDGVELLVNGLDYTFDLDQDGITSVRVVDVEDVRVSSRTSSNTELGVKQSLLRNGDQVEVRTDATFNSPIDLFVTMIDVASLEKVTLNGSTGIDEIRAYYLGEDFDGSVSVAVGGLFGGDDTAYLYDSPGDDRFTASPRRAFFSLGGAYDVAVAGAKAIHAYATAGGVDAAFLYGCGVDDTLMATPEYGKMYSDDYLNRAKLFEHVHAYGGDGFDRAFFYGTEGDDELLRKDNYTKLYGDSFSLRAKYFEEASVYGNGGNDTAYLCDSAIDDMLTADQNWAQLSNSQWLAKVLDFATVNAHSRRGGDDQCNLTEPLEFTLNRYGDW